MALLQALTQPATAAQLSRKLGISLDSSRATLRRLAERRLVRCLTPTMTRSRICWLTWKGLIHQRRLAGKQVNHDLPEIDWRLYASVCYSHRSRVITTLSRAMQPAEIKRRATFQTPGLRMSANNVRDVIRYLEAHDVVRPVAARRKAHPRYELTAVGLHMRRLLLQIEVRT